MSRAPQILGQVTFTDKSERAKIQKFCRTHYGRSYSAQCRFMLLSELREAEVKKTPKAKK
jgi:hypothetical protein